jgi:hypothetical protein
LHKPRITSAPSSSDKRILPLAASVRTTSTSSEPLIPRQPAHETLISINPRTVGRHIAPALQYCHLETGAPLGRNTWDSGKVFLLSKKSSQPRTLSAIPKHRQSPASLPARFLRTNAACQGSINTMAPISTASASQTVNTFITSISSANQPTQPPPVPPSKPTSPTNLPVSATSLSTTNYIYTSDSETGHALAYVGSFFLLILLLTFLLCAAERWLRRWLVCRLELSPGSDQWGGVNPDRTVVELTMRALEREREANERLEMSRDDRKYQGEGADGEKQRLLGR